MHLTIFNMFWHFAIHFCPKPMSVVWTNDVDTSDDTLLSWSPLEVGVHRESWAHRKASEKSTKFDSEKRVARFIADLFSFTSSFSSNSAKVMAVHPKTWKIRFIFTGKTWDWHSLKMTFVNWIQLAKGVQLHRCACLNPCTFLCPAAKPLDDLGRRTQSIIYSVSSCPTSPNSSCFSHYKQLI